MDDREPGILHIRAPPIKVIHIEHELNWARTDDMGGIGFSVTASLGGEGGTWEDQIVEG